MNDQIKHAHKNVYVALAVAQSEMEPVTKDAKNAAFKRPDGTVSRYADLAGVVDAVRPSLTANGLAYFHQMVMFNDAPAMRTVIYHGESDTSIACDVPLIVAANNMQGMKSATTYAKRIGLESVTGVAPEDDDGNAAGKAPPEATRKNKDATPQFDPKTAADRVIAKLQKQANLDNLNAAWAEEEDARAAIWEVSRDDFARVKKAAADRGSELKTPPSRPSDSVDDEIPY